jgi:5'(3')-deoxyribonucleotidase
MKNIISEVHRMRVLAGLLNESNENIKDQIQVWFDLDGVLADMEGSLQKNEELIRLKAELDKVVKEKFPDWATLTNDELKEKFKAGLEQDPNNADLKELKKAHREYTNYVFKIAGKSGFYASLALMPGAVELVQKANNIVGKKPNILTAPAGNENDPNNPSVIEKNQWVKDNFGDLVDHIEITIDKGRVVKSKYDILIDDRTKYVDKFTSAGGSAILYKDASQAEAELQKLYDELMSGN